MVFVDHHSRLKYVHLTTSTSSQQTVYDKQAFERYCRHMDVHIQHYHCDNGRFADNAFIEHCESQGQTITYCGAYTHFQNGIAEKAIRDLQEGARKMLLHAKERWPGAISLSLWPYALILTNEIMNNLPDESDGSSKIERFSRVQVNSRLQDWHTFGCPVFMLTRQAQQGTAKKWDPRSRVGIYLGPSPCHAGNISLILNPATGLASPQFHVAHDDCFVDNTSREG